MANTITFAAGNTITFTEDQYAQTKLYTGESFTRICQRQILKVFATSEYVQFLTFEKK